MKLKIVAAALLVMLLSVGVTQKASAQRWGYRGGWGRPHVGVRVVVPPIPVPAVTIGGGYYGDGYCAPAPVVGGYYDGGYCAPAPVVVGGGYYGGYYRGYRGGYGRPYAYGGGYRGGYRDGGYRGGGYRGGGYRGGYGGHYGPRR